MSLSAAPLSFQIWTWKEAFILMSLGEHLGSTGLRGTTEATGEAGSAHKATVFIVRANRRGEKVPARRFMERNRFYAMCDDRHLKRASVCLDMQAAVACS